MKIELADLEVVDVSITPNGNILIQCYEDRRSQPTVEFRVTKKQAKNLAVDLGVILKQLHNSKDSK